MTENSSSELYGSRARRFRADEAAVAAALVADLKLGLIPPRFTDCVVDFDVAAETFRFLDEMKFSCVIQFTISHMNSLVVRLGDSGG